MAMKKKAPKKSDPKPPKSSMTDKAKVAGAAAKSKMSKETSAVTRAKAASVKKSGVGYAKKSEESMAGDLGGPNWKQLKGFEYGSPMFQRSRTEQRSLDQDKRAKTKSGKGYLKPAKSGLTFDSPYWLSKGNDLARGRTTQRAKDQAKRKKK